MLPLFHDFGGQVILVVGGGPVGLRKARFFGREARVVLLAEEFAAERATLPDDCDISLVKTSLAPSDVPGWFDRTSPALVVAATDDAELNDAVAAAARERGVLVNRADRSGDRAAGSVVVPATVRDGDVVAAIATGGRSPAVSKQLRRDVESLLDGSEALAALVADLRETLQSRSVPPEERRDALRAVTSSEQVQDALATEDEFGASPRSVAERVVRDSLGEAYQFEFGRE
jgi:precorrin-2 dehydrogenase/sirohydrochlorin ferrochelatase